MGQLGFFDADKRLAALSAKGDPLEAINRLVPWESFRADIEAVVLTPEEMRKSSAGRKPLDAIVMFRMLVLQALNNLSDEQAEYQVRDRLSFTRFLRLGIEDNIPDATTLWLFREKLAKAGLIGHGITPDQLVLGVRVHMVLVAEEAAAMLLDPARIAVLLPHFGGLLLPPRWCAPSLQLGVLVTTVPLRRHRYNTGVDNLPATRHVALGCKMLVEAVKQLLNQPGLGQLLAEQP